MSLSSVWVWSASYGAISFELEYLMGRRDIWDGLNITPAPIRDVKIGDISGRWVCNQMGPSLLRKEDTPAVGCETDQRFIRVRIHGLYLGYELRLGT